MTLSGPPRAAPIQPNPETSNVKTQSSYGKNGINPCTAFVLHLFVGGYWDPESARRGGARLLRLHGAFSLAEVPSAEARNPPVRPPKTRHATRRDETGGAGPTQWPLALRRTAHHHAFGHDAATCPLVRSAARATRSTLPKTRQGDTQMRFQMPNRESVLATRWTRSPPP